MNVKELVKQLKKIPQDLEVYRADHDHGTFETAGIVNSVQLINKEDMNKYNNDGADGGVFKDTPNKYVVIRP